MAGDVPLGPISATLACARHIGGDRECGEPAVMHISWYVDGVSALNWENSLCCQEHADEAQRLWSVGWKHHVSHACGMPGAFFRIDAEAVDADGVPITFCYHPWDAAAETESAEPEMQACV